MEHANFSSRLGAYVIDVVIIYIIAVFLGMFLPVSDAYITASKKGETLYEEIMQSAQNGETPDALLEEYQGLQYTMMKESIPHSILSVAIYIGYFIVFQYYKNGQTLGKKFMKIRIKKENGKLEFNDVILRSLITNGILYNMILLVMVIVLGKEMYLNSAVYVEYAQIIFVISSVFMILYRKDRRGIQDFLCKTVVVKE